MVSTKYYWPGLSLDIRQYVSHCMLIDKSMYQCYLFPQIASCDRCQHNSKKLVKAAGCLNPIAVQPKIWQQVGMDLIGPLTETARGNKYIITLTDYFSKWAEAAPLPDKSASGVAHFIYSVS